LDVVRNLLDVIINAPLGFLAMKKKTVSLDLVPHFFAILANRPGFQNGLLKGNLKFQSIDQLLYLDLVLTGVGLSAAFHL
jgi:hypothetical protein